MLKKVYKGLDQETINSFKEIYDKNGVITFNDK